MNVRCPVCGSAVQLAVGETRLACTACGLAAPLSHVGTMPGTPPSASFALETDLTGTTLGRYQLVERIGAGGMGTVYRARASVGVATESSEEGPASDVAIKVLRPGLGAERAAMLARFAREAEAMRRLAHPRVVRFLDHSEAGDTAYIVTELVEGRDLAGRLAQGRMSLAEIVDVFGQVCDGVAAAHAAGMVHRDLKPANILVGASGVKVADFGLAQLGAADVAIPTLTRTNVAMGTFHYLSPEQRKNAHGVDHRADVWALGVIFYEMLTGELPLGAFAPPSTSGPAGCDRRVDAIVQRALAPDPAARYATVDEFARDVRALIAPPRSKRRVAYAAGAALALAGSGTAVAFAISGSDPPARVAAAPDAAASVTPDAVESIASRPVEPIEGSAAGSADGSGSSAAVAALPDKPVEPDLVKARPDKLVAEGSGAPTKVVPPVKGFVKPGGKVKAPTKDDGESKIGKVPGGKVSKPIAVGKGKKAPPSPPKPAPKPPTVKPGEK